MSEDEAAGRAWLVENLGCAPDVLDRLAAFATALRLESTRQNLISAAGLDRLWWRHIVDSAQLLRLVHQCGVAAGPWLDLGTGAGFPGVIVAILDARRPVRLIEERRLRFEWLQRVVVELELGNVEVIGGAVERATTVAAAVISARAFAPLPKLLHLSARFSTPDTLWLLPKGEKAAQEVGALPEALRAMFHVEPSVTHPQAGIVVGRGAVPC